MWENFKGKAVFALGEADKFFAFLDQQAIFWTFVVIGVISSLILILTLVLGELSDVFHGVFGGDHDFSGGDHDVGHSGDHGVEHHAGDVHTGESDQTGGTPSFMSIRFGFSFLSGFGITGAIATYSGVKVVASSFLGTVIGLALTVVTYTFVRILASQQASVNIGSSDFLGNEGRVTIDIPKDGMGEILIQIGEVSITKLAQSADNQPIFTNTRVKIVSVPGQMVIVERIQPA